MALPLTTLSRRPTKFQSVCDRLTDIAFRLGPGAKLPTVLQLRDQLGVSVATLNSALTELEAQQVLQRRHGVGIFVSSRLHHQRIVLLCDPSVLRSGGASPFWDMLIEQSQRRAAARAEEFSLHFARPVGPREAPVYDALLSDIEAGRVDGILAVGAGEEAAAWIDECRVPMVAFAGPGRYVIALDGGDVVRRGVETLAHQGCRRIAFWSAVAPFRPSRPHPNNEREDVREFRAALTARGLFEPSLARDYRDRLTAENGYQTVETHQEQGYRIAMSVFGPGSDAAARPDGIVSADDMLTQGALTALARLGVRVSEDVKIATHANVGSKVLLGWEDDLTLVEVDPAAVVCAMFEMLETLMEGRQPPSTWVSVPHAARSKNNAAVETLKDTTKVQGVKEVKEAIAGCA